MAVLSLVLVTAVYRGECIIKERREKGGERVYVFVFAGRRWWVLARTRNGKSLSNILFLLDVWLIARISVRPGRGCTKKKKKNC